MTGLKTYEVTGNPEPNCRGTYEDAGEWNGKRLYRRLDEAYFIWWKDPANWYISETKNGVPVNNWSSTDPAIEGDYYPDGTYEGVATVTEI